MGTNPRRVAQSEGDNGPEGQTPCGRGVVATIVVLLILAWAAGSGTARPAARGADALTRG
jgi:hypothetical protein